MTARVALFRARADAKGSAARLRRLGFSVVCLPAIEIKAQAILPERPRYDAVIATSGKAFLGEGPSDTSPPLYVVGAHTGRAAKARGWRLASPPAPDAAKLTETLNRSLKPGASVLYLAGRDRKETIEAALAQRFRARGRRGLRGRGARGLEPSGDARTRLLRRSVALFTALGWARGGAGQSLRRRSALSRARARLPVARCRRTARGGGRGPDRDRRNG